MFFGIAYPGNGLPGAVVTVGVLKEIDNPPLIVREFVGEEDILDLYQRGDELRNDYFVKGGRIGTVWYGEVKQPILAAASGAQSAMVRRATGQTALCCSREPGWWRDRGFRSQVYVNPSQSCQQTKAIFQKWL